LLEIGIVVFLGITLPRFQGPRRSLVSTHLPGLRGFEALVIRTWFVAMAVLSFIGMWAVALQRYEMSL
jgi:hypothetical protein